MSKIRFYLIAMLAITILQHLSAQIWSTPERVSPYAIGYYAIFSQYGLTTDGSGIPWCGWSAETHNPLAWDMYVSYYCDTTWSAPDTIYPFWGFESCDLTTDADGNVWVVAKDYTISACYYNGISWSNLMQVPSQGTCCHYPVAAGDTLGNMYVCWAGGGPGDGHHIWGNVYSQGQWGSPVLISYSGYPDPGEFPYSMTTDKQGRVWVGWCWSLYFRGAILVSFNDGNEWSDTMIIARYSYAAYGPALAVDTVGMVWAGWIHADAGAGNYSLSADYYNGYAWSAPMFVDTGQFDAAITCDNIGIVWLSWCSPNHDIYYSYWNGDAWSNPAPIDTNPADDYWPKMTFDGERIWVTWYSVRDGSPGIFASYTYGLDVEEKPIANQPLTPRLSQNYPNPFKKTTTSSYALAASTKVNLSIYDVTGRKVATLVDAYKQSGIYQIDFNATGLTSGVYIYRLKTEQFTTSRRVVLIR